MNGGNEDDPLAGYTPDWKSKAAGPAKPAADDPLAGYDEYVKQRERAAKALAKAQEDQRIATRRKDVTAFDDAAQGVFTGLAKSGYGAIKGTAWLADQIPGVDLTDARDSIAADEKNAVAFYDAQGTAGRAGELGGRVLGEGALAMLGTQAVVGGLAKGGAKLATTTGTKGAAASRLGTAGNVGRRAVAAADRVKAAQTAKAGADAGKLARVEAFAKRSLANTLPGAPIDALLGAGAAEEGERLEGAAIGFGLGQGAGAALSGVGSVVGAGISKGRELVDAGRSFLRDDAMRAAQANGISVDGRKIAAAMGAEREARLAGQSQEIPTNVTGVRDPADVSDMEVKTWTRPAVPTVGEFQLGPGIPMGDGFRTPAPRDGDQYLGPSIPMGGYRAAVPTVGDSPLGPAIPTRPPYYGPERQLAAAPELGQHGPAIPMGSGTVPAARRLTDGGAQAEALLKRLYQTDPEAAAALSREQQDALRTEITTRIANGQSIGSMRLPKPQPAPAPVAPAGTADAPAGVAAPAASAQAGPLGGSISNEVEQWKGQDAYRNVIYRDADGVERGRLNVYLDESGNPRGQSIFVDDEWQRKGIGTALYREAERLGLSPLENAGKVTGQTPAGASLVNKLRGNTAQAGDAAPISVFNPEGRLAIVSRSAQEPGRWQGTRFHDDAGTRPAGHVTGDSPNEVQALLADEGYSLRTKPTVPDGDPKYESLADELSELDDIRANGDDWTPENEARRQAVIAEMRSTVEAPQAAADASAIAAAEASEPSVREIIGAEARVVAAPRALAPDTEFMVKLPATVEKLVGVKLSEKVGKSVRLTAERLEEIAETLFRVGDKNSNAGILAEQGITPAAQAVFRREYDRLMKILVDAEEAAGGKVVRYPSGPGMLEPGSSWARPQAAAPAMRMVPPPAAAPAAPVKPAKPAKPAPRAGLKLKPGQIGKLSTADVIERLAAEQRLRADDELLTGTTSVFTSQSTGITYAAGDTAIAASARKRLGYSDERIAELEARLVADGIEPGMIHEMRYDEVLAAERSARMRADAGEKPPEPEILADDLRESQPYLSEDVVRGPDGVVLFANPVGNALKQAYQRNMLSKIAGASTGASVGLWNADEGEELEGALIGGGIGLLAGSMTDDYIRDLRRSRAVVRTPMSPSQAAAYQAARKQIDPDGSIRKQMVADYGKLAAGPARNVIGGALLRFRDGIGEATGSIDRLGRAVEQMPGVSPIQSARVQLTFQRSSEARVESFWNDGITDNYGNIVNPDASLKSVYEPLGTNPDAILDFDAYIKAKREVGRVAVDGDLSFIGGDAAAHARNLEVVAHGDADPLFSAQAAKVQEYLAGVRQYAVDAGLWTPEMAARFAAADPFYVPFSRVRLDGIAGPSKPSGMTTVFAANDGARRAVGSALPVERFSETIANYTAEVVRRADRYRVGNAIIDNVERLGPAGQMIMSRLDGGAVVTSANRANSAASAEAWRQGAGLPPDADVALMELADVKVDANNPTVWRWEVDDKGNSVRRQYLIHSPGLVNAISSLDPQVAEGLLKYVFAPLKRLFTATTTGLSVKFAAGTNLARDFIGLQTQSEAGVAAQDIIRGYAAGIADLSPVRGADSYTQTMRRAGVGGSSLVSQPTNPKRWADRVAPTSAKQNLVGRAREGSERVIGMAERLGDASDIAPRAAEFHATMRKFQHKVDSGEWTINDLTALAATNARGATIDFSSKSGYKILRSVGPYVPFFQVGLTAPVVFTKAIMRSPARVAAVAASVATASIAGWALRRAFYTDEQQAEFMDRSTTERASYFHAPLGQTGVTMRWALPAEMGLVHTATTAMMDELAGGDPHTADMIVEAFKRMTPNYIPPGIKEAVEIRSNTAFYGDRPINPRRLESVPVAERRQDTTSPTFDMIAAGARKIPGMEDISPLDAEHAVRGLFSSHTPTLAKIIDPIAERVTGRSGDDRIPQRWQEGNNPAAAFVATRVPGGTMSERDYYDQHDQLDQAASFKAQQEKAGVSGGELEKRLAPYAHLLNDEARAFARVTDERLREIREEEITVQRAFAAGSIDESDARRLRDYLKRDRQQMYRGAARLMRQAGIEPK